MRIGNDAILLNAATLPGKTPETSHGGQRFYLQFTKDFEGAVDFVNMKRDLCSMQVLAQPATRNTQSSFTQSDCRVRSRFARCVIYLQSPPVLLCSQRASQGMLRWKAE
ncbi:hypothetical protein IG631_07742 [Alternaria alternata]|nr:hypothetical protein IG631_07742 [Alternaria alternata]